MESLVRVLWQNACLFFSIDMYTEGVADLEIMILYYPFMPSEEKEASLASIKDKARNRYFPAYEKVGVSWLTSHTFRGSNRPLKLKLL